MGNEMATSQDFVNWVCGPRLRSRYLHYLLVSEQGSIRRFAHGSVHPTVYYPEVKAFHVCVPELPEQDAILSVLKALDDKVAGNERIETKSYELAQYLWHREVSRSAGMTTFAEVAQLDKGLSYKGSHLGAGTPMVNLANFQTDGTFSAHQLKYYSGEHKERHKVKDGSLVIANTDLTQRREVLGQPAIVATGHEYALFSHHVYAVRPYEGNDSDVLWLYGALQDSAFHERAVTFASGTTVAALPKDAVLAYELPWPPREVRRAWSEKVEALFATVNAARAESVTLRRLRDTLLPKLISGKLRVNDAEQAVEEAT